jgi:RNA methyltransferase, TrmH family
MISKAQIAHIRSLHQKKFRKETQFFIAEGTKSVLELMRSDMEIEAVFATQDWVLRNNPAAFETQVVSEAELSRITSLVTAQDVLALVRIPQYKPDITELQKEWVLCLDGIRDPGNLGTMIRLADWFGIRHILCSEDTAEVWNPKVIQASMGSISRVKTYELNIEEFLPQLNSKIYGSFLEGKSIYETPYPSSGVLVIGNEANGIRPELAGLINEQITIPSYSGTSGAESLNAAIATAIICAEIRRNGN